MPAHYIRAMDVLQRACMVVAGLCLVIITLIIPWGVFTRYVLNSASSWPEPMAILVMIWLSFLVRRRCATGRICTSRSACCLGMLHRSARGSRSAYSSSSACCSPTCSCSGSASSWCTRLGSSRSPSFRIVSVGVSYLPVPIGGAITALFVIERMWTGRTSSQRARRRCLAHVSTE